MVMKPRTEAREPSRLLDVTLDSYAHGRGAPAYFGYGGPDLMARIEERLAAPHVMVMGASTTARWRRSLGPVTTRHSPG